jgi:hypothetical protein
MQANMHDGGQCARGGDGHSNEIKSRGINFVGENDGFLRAVGTEGKAMILRRILSVFAR